MAITKTIAKGKKMQLDIKTLAALVVARAKADKTSPNPSNIRDGWRTDQLLTGDVDMLVVYTENKPATYADIGRLVRAQVGNLPEMAALAGLAVFRGERLLPQTDERKQDLLQMAEELEHAISLLPEGTRKTRCVSLLQYHTGVFYDAYGCFDKAAESQFQAAREAEKLGDKPATAISRFVGTLYSLKNALSGSGDKAEAEFEVLEQKYRELIEAVGGTNFDLSWGQGNGPIHMLQACVWLDRDHPDWEKWVETATTATARLGAAFAPSADLVRIFDDNRKDAPGVEETMTVFAGSNVSAEYKATTLLLLARRAIKAGKPDKAKELIVKIPEAGVQHIHAIASRLVN